MLLADRIIAEGIPDIGVAQTEPDLAKAMPKVLPRLTIFDISDVAEYLYAVTDQESWDLKTDFDCIAPPFPEFWMEYRKPSRVNSEEFGISDTSGWPQRVGIYAKAIDADVYHDGLLDPLGFVDYVEGLKMKAEAAKRIGLVDSIYQKEESLDPVGFEAALSETERYTYEVIRELREIRAAGDGARQLIHDRHVARGARWYMEFHLFMQIGPLHGARRECAQGPMARWDVAVNEQGRVLAFRYSSTPETVEIGHMLQSSLGTLFYPIALALDWLYLKNVEVKRVSIDPKQQKVHVKRHGSPLLRYHVLELEPLKKVLKEYGARRTAGFKQALHKVRLHYRHYGPAYGRGKLFGELEGSYKIMVPASVRGSASEGTTVKDYRIKKKNGDPQKD